MDSPSSNNYLSARQCIHAFNSLSRAHIGEYLTEKEGQLVFQEDYQAHGGWWRQKFTPSFRPWYYYQQFATALTTIKHSLTTCKLDLLQHSLKVMRKEEFEEFKQLVAELQLAMKNANEHVKEIQAGVQTDKYFEYYAPAFEEFKSFVDEHNQDFVNLIALKEDALWASALKSSELGQSLLGSNSAQISMNPQRSAHIDSLAIPAMQPVVAPANLPTAIAPAVLPSNMKPATQSALGEQVEVKDNKLPSKVKAEAKKPTFNAKTYCHPSFVEDDQVLSFTKQLVLMNFKEEIQVAKTTYDQARENLIKKLLVLNAKDLKAWQGDYTAALCLEIDYKAALIPQIPLATESPAGNLAAAGQRGAPPPPNQRGAPPPPPGQRGAPPPPGQRGVPAAPMGRGVSRKGQLAIEPEKQLTEKHAEVSLREEFVALELNFIEAYEELIKKLVDKETRIEHPLTEKELKVLIANTESNISKKLENSLSKSSKIGGSKASGEVNAEKQKVNAFIARINKAQKSLEELKELKLKLDKALKAVNVAFNQDAKKFSKAQSELVAVQNECKSLYEKHSKDVPKVEGEQSKEGPKVNDEHFMLEKIERLQALIKLINAQIENKDSIFALCQANCKAIKQKRQELEGSAGSEKAVIKKELEKLIEDSNKGLDQVTFKLFEEVQKALDGLKVGSLSVKDFASVASNKAPSKIQRAESAPLKLSSVNSEPKRPVKISARPAVTTHQPPAPQALRPLPVVPSSQPQPEPVFRPLPKPGPSALPQTSSLPPKDPS